MWCDGAHKIIKGRIYFFRKRTINLSSVEGTVRRSRSAAHSVRSAPQQVPESASVPALSIPATPSSLRELGHAGGPCRTALLCVRLQAVLQPD